jgi:hypothetical protein
LILIFFAHISLLLLLILLLLLQQFYSLHRKGYDFFTGGKDMVDVLRKRILENQEFILKRHDNKVSKVCFLILLIYPLLL